MSQRSKPNPEIIEYRQLNTAAGGGGRFKKGGGRGSVSGGGGDGYMPGKTWSAR